MREAADADARDGGLLGPLLDRLGGTERVVVRDLGCGTGSMGRWFAPRMPGPQHWILTDRDPVLLEHAARDVPAAVETDLRDVTDLTARDLAGTSLVTASALLDLLTAEEVDRLATACVEAGCPALLTLSVTGGAELAPPDPLDDAVAAAFDDHQRRTVDGRRLLGPDAVDAAAAAFERAGALVHRRPSPWRLGPEQRLLTEQWLHGWVGAAAEQEPDLDVADYLRRRRSAAEAGELAVTVHHEDLLALPR
ncbi:methyltransferase domain-containing protein [Actinophytocola xanthii]|uniref:SAM-dependent methyltransferase n=1 Tax=Actinophytocola xanthii TaxID=1912961 RepID=A0A1Q8CJZ5_9PSEU|nr:class I SAM-dependent methyltransferase [Actinophytocola xanthii]OLF14659.1 SAM-dependent methyltransferase [Actinophytocola xanthii]